MVAILSIWVPIVEGIITSLALIIGGYVALAWREKEVATAERDLARRLLITVYKMRDGIERARSERVEIEIEADPGGTGPSREIYARGLRQVEETRLGLEADLLEAEAVWGKTDIAVRASRKLILLLIRLEAASWAYYARGRPHDNQPKEMYEMLFRHANTEDAFGSQVLGHVQEIENKLRPRLKLRR